MALPREHLLERLATAYVHALAAAAGATIAVSPIDFGIDGTLKRVVRIGDRFVPTGMPVEYQLKATTTASIEGSRVKYDLNVRNYDILVDSKKLAPIYLFLVCFCADPNRWIVHESERLMLSASAFWWTHTGPISDHASSVRIEISSANRLDANALAEMLKASRDELES